MKLQSSTIVYIQDVVEAAQVVGIDSVIIEPDCVRGIDENKSVVLLHDKDVPTLEFGSIGINRISVFKSRLNIAKTQENFTVDAIVNDDDGYARSLTMKGKGVKIDYRTANPATIKAPKQVNDELLFKMKMNAEGAVMLAKAQVAMSADVVTITSSKNGVSLELVDINNDVFSYKFTDDVELLSDEDNINFAHRYPSKLLSALFSRNANCDFSIGRKGILSISVEGFSVFVLPQV